MLKEIISILILLLLFHLGLAPLFGQSAKWNAETSKVKTELAKRGTGEKSKVKIELRDKREVKGYLAALDEEDFVLTDSKTGERTTVRYADVAKVKGKGFSFGAKLGIVAAVVATVVVAVAAVGAKNLDDDIFPSTGH